MKVSRFSVAILALLCWSQPARAQQTMTLQIHNGFVNLKTDNVPVSRVLAEWARIGSTTILNGDRIAGPPVTLELINVPERQALEILLRDVAGYMLTARTPGSVGLSAFDRIFILPTSTPPRTPATTTAAPRPFMPPPPAAVQVEPGDGAAGAAASNPLPGAPRAPGRVAFPPPPRTTPNAPPQASPDGSPPIVLPGFDPEPAETAPALPSPAPTTPTNPFGIPNGSSSTPGVIAAPARAPEQAPPQEQEEQQN